MGHTDPLFPLWQLDAERYRRICAHLGLTPQPALLERLNQHLAQAPWQHPAPTGLALHLAQETPSRLGLACLDLITRLRYPTHPLRHQLNGVLALHECHPRGFHELCDTSTGLPAWGFLALQGLRLTATATLAGPWLVWKGLRSGFGRRLAPLSALRGRTVLITGVNRGLGHDLMLTALQLGARVVGTVRTPETREALMEDLPAQTPLQLVEVDLARPGALVQALESADIEPGQIDLAVLSAGVKHSGVPLHDTARLRETFEVNFFSAADFARWYCRRPQPGRLVLVSSMGRWHGMHSSCGYNASKAALSIWGESLELEQALQPGPGCSILVVEPGLFTSGMVSGRGLAGRLAASRRHLAPQILAAALAGRRTLRPPLWFAGLTWGICLGGRRLRQWLLTRTRTAEGP